MFLRSTSRSSYKTKLGLTLLKLRRLSQSKEAVKTHLCAMMAQYKILVLRHLFYKKDYECKKWPLTWVEWNQLNQTVFKREDSQIFRTILRSASWDIPLNAFWSQLTLQQAWMIPKYDSTCLLLSEPMILETKTRPIWNWGANLHLCRLRKALIKILKRDRCLVSEPHPSNTIKT